MDFALLHYYLYHLHCQGKSAIAPWVASIACKSLCTVAFCKCQASNACMAIWHGLKLTITERVTIWLIVGQARSKAKNCSSQWVSSRSDDWKEMGDVPSEEECIGDSTEIPVMWVLCISLYGYLGSGWGLAILRSVPGWRLQPGTDGALLFYGGGGQ